MNIVTPRLAEYAGVWRDMVPHLAHLMDLASDATTVVEFGVRGGVSTWALLDGLPADGTLVSVDVDPRVAAPDALAERITRDPRWRLVIGDSRFVELPEHADLVFIDSGHEYDLTVGELWRAHDLEPERIALHDYLYQGDPTCQVYEAVDDWVELAPWRIERIYVSTWGIVVLEPAP